MGLKKRKRRPWSYYTNPKHADKATSAGVDLVDKLLMWDHESRLTARQALEHPFFDPIRDIEIRQSITPELASSDSSSTYEYEYYDSDGDDDGEGEDEEDDEDGEGVI